MGDRHQLPSVESLSYNFEKTQAILKLVNYNFTELKVNYRQDPLGLEYSNKIIHGLDYELPKSTRRPEIDDINIAYLNKTRRMVNKNWNIKIENSMEVNLDEWETIKDASGNNVKLKLNEKGYLYAGVKVICTKTLHTGYTDEKTKVYFLTSQTGYIWNVYGVTIEILTEDNLIHKVYMSNFENHFTLGYCITIHKAQGQTYSNHINIYNSDLIKKMDYKYMYTAISRATKFNHINFM
jgi:hypothetical protein